MFIERPNRLIPYTSSAFRRLCKNDGVNYVHTYKKNIPLCRLSLFYFIIFTFSKQSLNESLDFCNRSYPHELHKFD